MKSNQYSRDKTIALIEAAKKAVDILIETLSESFDFDETSDASKLKTFVESKKVAFFSAKEIISEIEKLELALEANDVDLTTKEYSTNYLEETSKRVK